jgi:hypothetical protein
LRRVPGNARRKFTREKMCEMSPVRKGEMGQKAERNCTNLLEDFLHFPLLNAENALSTSVCQ